MFVFLALLFVPLMEIALFVSIGGEIGLTATLLVVLVTALIGSITIRRQGLNTLQKLRTLKADQEAPIVMIEGVMVGAAGLLLLTPGFLTDAIGFLLLIPPVRRYLAKRAMAQTFVYFAGGVSPGSDARGGAYSDQSASRGAARTSHLGAKGTGARNTAGAQPKSDARGGKPERGDIEDAHIIEDEPPQRPQ